MQQLINIIIKFFIYHTRGKTWGRQLAAFPGKHHGAISIRISKLNRKSICRLQIIYNGQKIINTVFPLPGTGEIRYFLSLVPEIKSHPN